MKKDELKNLIERYQFAEKQISKLYLEFGICLWNSRNSNFYNEYNYIISKLLKTIFKEKSEVLEEYLFDQTSMTFDELYDYLNE
jgi:hypothetical protein